MSNILSKEQIVENIHYICTNKKIKIGTLEKECGVSPGYLSRIYNSKTKDGYPNVEFLYKVSKYLKVPLDFILSVDYDNPNIPSECDEDYFRFVEKLIRQTATKEVIWERIDSNRWLDENDKNYIDLEEDMELELLVQEFELEPEKYGKVDVVFRLYFKDNHCLFIIKTESGPVYMKYIGRTKGDDPIAHLIITIACNEDYIQKKFEELLSQLYDMVVRKTSRFKVSKRFIKFIFDYIEEED